MTLPSFQPVFPMPVILGVAAVAAMLALARAFLGRALRPAWLQAPVLLLRFGSIALVAVFLLNPSDSIFVQTPESHSLVLVDESASMSLGAPSRWDEAKQWLEQFRRGMIAEQLSPPSVAVFSSGVEPVKDLEGRRPAGNETRLSAAIARVLATAGSNPPDHLIVISDGRAQDRAALPAALAQAHASGTGISTLVVGSDTPPRNAGIATVAVPRVVRANTRVNVRVELSLGGYAPNEPVLLSLKNENGARLGGMELRAPAPGGALPECVLTFDSGVRTARYTLELATDGRDVARDDDRFDFTLEVATSKLRVLFVEGTHVKRSVGTNGYWWNDMELMTRAWDATGEIDYECLTPVSEYTNKPNLVGVSFANGEMIPDRSHDFPKTREELYRYDVMLISDVPVGNFSTDQMQWVVDWVNERGGGFLMGGGYTSFDVGDYDQTPWERITPVDMLAFGDGFNEQRFKVEIPKAVRQHPTWRISPDPAENDRILNAHPDFTGMNRVKRAKPGAIVLMTRPSMNHEPVIAAQQYGRGRSIAYLGDPNGGWAKFLVSWGPPGGPVQGPHTEIGHGDRFKVNVAATKTAAGPPPPHPAPYYAQYWVNVVKWLGENSIRWRRDKLAGDITVTQAQPGQSLPVAAEVLAVTNRDALLALNVGARLDRPGSPRVRLEYDRDRREFTGAVPVPADFAGGEVNVLFDTVAAGESLTDSVRVGVRHTNREFADSAPDRAFLAELAQVGGGRALGSVAEAVAVCREAAMKRAHDAQRTWSQPAWTKWPWWSALVLLLCAEWAFRRLAATNAAVAAGAVLVMLGSVLPAGAVVKAEKTEEAPVEKKAPATAAEISALIEQLGAPRVRLRDEAEEKLKALPEALPAVKAAMQGAASPEARLRARNVLQALRQNVWQQELVAEGHRLQPTSFVRGLVVSADGQSFYTRGEDWVRAWDAATCTPRLTFGPTLGMWRDWQRSGPPRVLAVSPDNQRVYTTDDIGNIFVHRASDGSVLLRFQNADPASGRAVAVNMRTLWGMTFFPDGKTLVTYDRGGYIRLWNPETGELIKSIPAMVNELIRAVTVSPDGKWLVCSIDYGGEPDHVWIWSMDQETWTYKQTTVNRFNQFVFTRDGKRMLGVHHLGRVYLWNFTSDGKLADERILTSVGSNAMEAVFSPDEKSVFIASGNVGEGFGALSQWDVATGEELWRSPYMESGFEGVSALAPDRLVTIGADDRVRIWQRRGGPVAK